MDNDILNYRLNVKVARASRRCKHLSNIPARTDEIRTKLIVAQIEWKVLHTLLIEAGTPMLITLDKNGDVVGVA